MPTLADYLCGLFQMLSTKWKENGIETINRSSYYNRFHYNFGKVDSRLYYMAFILIWYPDFASSSFSFIYFFSLYFVVFPVTSYPKVYIQSS